MQIDFYKFFADWCAPCKEYSKVVDQLKEAYPVVNYYSINVDTDDRAPEFIDKYNIRSIPFTIIRVDGEDKFVKAGFLTLQQVKEQIMNIIL